MSEKEFDSSHIAYEENPNKELPNQGKWNMAIGLQKIDKLEPSECLKQLSQNNIEGVISVEQVKEGLRAYYIEKEKEHQINPNEYECDFVSTRIVEILNIDQFELSIDYLKKLHQYIFQDTYQFAGQFRTVNFSKPEKILNKNSVAYGDYKTLDQSLNYDISIEKRKDYKRMSIVEVINSLVKFTTNIWQVHPFREGNTRTIAVFIQKYLRSLGYEVENSTFKEHSVYFRNALVRSNYFNNALNIKEDSTYLVKFFENLLLGKTNNLQSYDLIIDELFEERKTFAK